MLTVLDLFSGACGGWSLGMHLAGGFRTVAACEIDPWRRAAFGRRNHEALLYADVRDLTAARLLDDLGRLPDVVVASPPCQDASSANHRGRGVDGDRTGLFFEYLRLVREVRPRWCVAENVSGIRVRGVDRVLEGLQEAGYACWPVVVGADDVGANHRRKRVWIVAADADCLELRQQPRWCGGANWAYTAEPACRRDGSDSDGQGEHALPGDAAAMGRRAGAAILARSYAANTECGRSDRRDIRSSTPPAILPAEDDGAPWAHWNGGPPRAGLLDDGLPARLAGRRIAAFGDAVIPQLPFLLGRWIMMMEGMEP